MIFTRNVRQKITGTLIERFSQSVTTRLNPSSAKELFSTQDYANKKYVKNDTCWAKTVDLTCCSPYNYSGGPRQAGTLITPQHIVTASHYGLGVGSRLHFLTKELTVIETKVIAAAAIPDSDILIGKLENPLPSAIKPATLFTPDIITKIGYGYGTPILTLDQEEKALVSTLISLQSGVFVHAAKPTDSIQLNLYEDKISGDSGNPVFVLYGDNPILISHLRYGGAGSGPSYIGHYQKIIDTINYLGGSNFINTFDVNLALQSDGVYITKELNQVVDIKSIAVSDTQLLETTKIAINPTINEA